MNKKKEQLNRVKEVLKAQGRTRTWLAEKAGISYVVATNYSNNNVQRNIEVPRQIAGALDVDVKGLFVSTKNDN